MTPFWRNILKMLGWFAGNNSPFYLISLGDSPRENTNLAKGELRLDLPLTVSLMLRPVPHTTIIIILRPFNNDMDVNGSEISFSEKEAK